jgi:hypothetical protein
MNHGWLGVNRHSPRAGQPIPPPTTTPAHDPSSDAADAANGQSGLQTAGQTEPDNIRSGMPSDLAVADSQADLAGQSELEEDEIVIQPSPSPAPSARSARTLLADSPHPQLTAKQ